MLLNLTKNAIQSINKTHNKGVIKLIAETGEYSNIILSIEDNGAGIPLGIQNQIFIVRL